MTEMTAVETCAARKLFPKIKLAITAAAAAAVVQLIDSQLASRSVNQGCSCTKTRERRCGRDLKLLAYDILKQLKD